MALFIPTLIKITYVIVVCVGAATIFWWMCKQLLENWVLWCGRSSAITRQVIEECRKLKKLVVKIEKHYHNGMYNHIRSKRHGT